MVIRNMPDVAEPLKVLEQSVSDVASSVQDNTTSISDLSATVQGHSTSLSELSSTVQGHTTSLDGLSETVQGHSTELEGLTTTVQAHSTHLEEIATTEKLGHIKPDGTTVTVSSEGVLSAVSSGGSGGTGSVTSEVTATNGLGVSGSVTMRKDDVGCVIVNINISNTMFASGNVIFTLPTGYRPNTLLYRIVHLSDDSLNNQIHGVLAIDTAGEVTISGNLQSGYKNMVDSFTFYAS